MQTEAITPLVETAIRERRMLEIDYEHPDGTNRGTRVVAPFDIGTTDPNLKANFKDNLYAFSADHMDPDTEEPQPHVLVFAIGRIHSARLLDQTFDPEQLRTAGLDHDPVDWAVRPFNLVSDRGWFVPTGARTL
jgi:predicted DNA-binding transcriptional regulator YafY